jgi:hypothetical protein
MNGYTSFFKPSSSDVSYCDMITTHNKQSFSTTGIAGSFVSATGRSDHLGGYYYRVDGVTVYATSWGVQPWAGYGGHNYKGGCCPWGSDFTVDIFVDPCEASPGVASGSGSGSRAAATTHRIYKCYVVDGSPKLFKYFGCDDVISSSKVLTSDQTGSAKWCHLEAKSSEQMLCQPDNDSTGRSYLHHCDEYSSVIFSANTWPNSGTIAWTSGFNNNRCHGQPANTRPRVTFEQEGYDSYDRDQPGECKSLKHAFTDKGCCSSGSGHNFECAGVKEEFNNRGCCP